MKWLRGRRPSPALVISLIAFVVACAGTAGAATGVLIKSSSQVAPGSIESSDLRNGRAVNVADLTPAARAALRGVTGPQGGQGQPGVNGRDGKDGVTSLHYVAGGGNALGSGTNGGVSGVELQCDPGEHAIAGGADLSLTPSLELRGSYPSDGNLSGNFGDAAWTVWVKNTNSATTPYDAFAICTTSPNVTTSKSKLGKLAR